MADQPVNMDATQPVWTCGCQIPHFALTEKDKGVYKCSFGCGMTYGVDQKASKGPKVAAMSDGASGSDAAG